MRAFIIISHAEKHLFKQKRRIIEVSSKRYQIEVYFGSKIKDLMQFDLAESMKRLLEADFYLADLSYERPSCYFEVGYIQALGYPIQIIAQKGTEIYQILDRERVEFYSDLEEFTLLVEDTFKAFAQRAES